MSTHCGIAIKTEEGYNTIYCHHDGYPSYMRDMLTTNYNSEELATKLVSLGDASSIREKLEPTTPAHSFDNPERDVCIFYGRDRGESDTEPYCYSKKELFNNYYFVYIFENDYWVCYEGGKRVS